MALTFEELVAISLVNDQAALVAQWTAKAMHDDIGPFLSWRAQARFYDSPLEAVFDMWWTALQKMQRIGGDVALSPQHGIECRGRQYRLDFLLEPEYDDKLWFDSRGHGWPRFALELDGHDFHERTKEQVAHRNQRDRDLQLDGWTVLHYSGSELVRDPAACVVNCYHEASAAFFRHKRAVMAAEGAADTQKQTPS